MLEFNSVEFLAACREEIDKRGYCYLRESLSRCGGQSIEYLVETEAELKLLPIREQALWTIYVSKENPFVFASKPPNEYLTKTEDSVELQSFEGKILMSDWLDRATPKLKALVYTNGEAILGSY